MSIKEWKLDGCSFPIVLSPSQKSFNVINWAKENKSHIKNLLNKHGAILFRGFFLPSIITFEKFAAACTSENWVEYVEQTSPRTRVKSNTSTSTEYAHDRQIFPHNELSYSGTWPHYIFFYCKQPAQNGGETPLTDCRALYRDIPEYIMKKFKEKKLLYVRQFSNHMGIPWKRAFAVDSEEEMAKYCKENFIDDLHWKADGTPKLSYKRDVAIMHPDTGDYCWFNHGAFFNSHSLEGELKDFFLSNFSIDELPYNTFYGDGEPIEPDDIDILRSLYYKHSVKFQYEKYDVILADNMLIAHGRAPFEGERQIMVTMTEPVRYDAVKK